MKRKWTYGTAILLLSLTTVLFYAPPFVGSEQIMINANQQPGVDLVAIYPNEGSLWQDHS
mgnify:CR=1 FL=1